MTTKVAAAVTAGTALWLSVGLLAVTDAETARRIGFLPPWWLLPIFIAAATGIVVGLRVPAAESLPLFLSLLIVLPWLPLPVPDAFLAMTGPSVVLVWGAIACALIAIAVRRKRSWPQPLHRLAGAWSAAGIVAFVVFLGIWAGQRLPPTGDEPHYLVIAQSLLRDHDVKVANNYARGDYLPYYGGFLTPHFAPGGAGGDRYPGHGIGLSAIVAPAFALGGYRAVVIWIAALVAIGTALVWKAGYILTGDVGAAWFGWAVVTLTAPVAVYGSLIYPDSIAGIVFAACAFAVVQANAQPAQVSPWPLIASLALGVGLGVLPWLHVRLALPAAIFAIVLVARAVRFSQRRWAHVIAIAAPFAACVAGFMAFSWLISGSVNPAASIGDRTSLQLQRIPVGLLALLTDQEFGLLPNAPVHLLSFAGLWTLFKRHNRLGVDLLLIIVPYTLALSAWSIWWAGACPPARFLVPVIFPLGVVASGLWARQGVRGRALSLTLLCASMLIAAVFAWAGDGALAYNDATGRARWLEWVSPLVDLSRAFPSFFRAGALSATSQTIADLTWPTATWVLAAVCGWMLSIALDRRLDASSTRTLVVPTCLVLSIGAAISGSWRAAGGNHLTPTRAQLELLHTSHGRLRPTGVQFSPWQVGSARELTTRFAITTSPFDTGPRNTLLLLSDVPAGDYRLEVTRASSSQGGLDLAIGRAAQPIERFPVSDEWTDYSFHLAASASRLIVTGNDLAMHSVERVAMVPVAPRDTSAEPIRARDAARYGPVVVYALDDRVSLDTSGFWVLGERRPDVIVSANKPVSFVDLVIRNMPVANTIRVRSGRWYVERALAPEEEWPVRVPLPEPVRDVTIGFDVASGVRPADLNPSSRDRRSLGCWVEVR